jgi:predicted TIM-barrel fold metal-dependent hydrolase
MLSRREGLAAAMGLAIGGLPELARAQAASTVRSPVTLDVPPGACDCHTHVFPDPAKFPMFGGRIYTPPLATADDLLALQKALKLDRVVLVQPSVYGTDNSAHLDAIRQLGPQRARGVAVIGPTTSAAELDAMHGVGMRGIRVNLETGGTTDPAVAKGQLETAAKQIAGRPWHMQVYARLSFIEALKEALSGLPMPVVFDHFAGAEASQSLDQAGFAAVIDLVKAGKAYVKISGAYRASREGAPDYPQVAAFAKALVAANPDRIVWGTDWPHPDSYPTPGRKATDTAPPLAVDDGRLLNILAEWVPDAGTRKKILVDNPARLYGFPAA